MTGAEQDRDLLAPIETIAKRRDLRRLFTVAVVSVTAVAGVHLLAAVTAWYGTPLPRASLLAVVAGGLGGGLSLFWRWRENRTARQISFDVDRLAGLDQRLATALELGRDGRNPVELALHRDALADAAGLDPRRLAPIVNRSLVYGGVALAAMAAALLVLPSPPATLPAQGLAGSESGDEAGTASLAATVEEAARLLAEDAEARSDPYLSAISRALGDLAAREDDPAALREQLADLLDLAADAYGERAPDWLGEAAGNRVAGLRERLDAFNREQERLAAAAREQADRRIALDEYSVDDTNVDPESMGPQRMTGTRDATPQNARLVDPDTEAGPLMGGEMPDGLRRMDPEELQLAGAAPSGAALQSGRGRSRAAGLGEETLEHDDAFAAIPFEPGDDVILTSDPEPGGRRIRIEIVPEAGPETATGAVGALAAAGQAPAPAPEPREFVPADLRKVTARYFARAAQ